VTSATVGTVSPIEATPLPSARLIADCMRLWAADRSAAPDSGISTMAATITPTIAAGAPSATTPSSKAGAKHLASITTDSRETQSNRKDNNARLPVGRA